MLRFSVVINTYNRSQSLRNTLLSLRRQTYSNFEVIVVNGPSTDDTEKVVAEFSPDVRLLHCIERNLSKSRNIGIAASAGDVVAFIDDDAEADPHWLEQLAEGYDSPRIGGVGGTVYDYTGVTFQYEYGVSDRRGNTDLTVRPPLWGYMHPQGDQFIGFLGANSSFRRDCLLEIGGFNEEFEYYLDETDVCMRIIDNGHWLRPVSNAFVYHRFLASHLRNDHKVLREPFQVMKNKTIFSIQSMRTRDSLLEVIEDCTRFGNTLYEGAKWNFDVGNLTTQELQHFRESIDRALRVGLNEGINGERRFTSLPGAKLSEFRPYTTMKTDGQRMTIVFVTREIPPGCGGIGRFTWDLAIAFAAQGHDIHLITESPDRHRVDFADGMWIHRCLPIHDGDWKTPETPPVVEKNLAWATAVHQEARRIASTRRVDIVSAPIWDTEGIFCQLDPSLNTVLTLETTLRTVVDMNPSWRSSPGMDQLLHLEEEVVRTARFITAPSQDVLNKVTRDVNGLGELATTRVTPLGVPDHSAAFASKRRDDKIRVLCVGRLEKRKGPDLLLAAAAILLPEFPNAEFVLVGNDRIPAEGSQQTYREQFLDKHGDESFASQVIFRGLVSEGELYQEYADCDIFCLPARYESFGLVLVEAMSFTKPVIASCIGGMAEIVVDENSGLLVYPDHVDSLVQALRRLLGDRKLREKMGHVSRARYLQHYTDLRMLERTLMFYREVAGMESGDSILTLPSQSERRAA